MSPKKIPGSLEHPDNPGRVFQNDASDKREKRRKYRRYYGYFLLLNVSALGLGMILTALFQMFGPGCLFFSGLACGLFGLFLSVLQKPPPIP